jgi:hypothetical protein
MFLDFSKSSLGLTPHLPHPGLGSILQFGVIRVLTSTGRSPQGFTLLTALDFVAGDLSQERAPAPLADQLIDVGNQIDGKNDVRSLAHFIGHTYSVT